MTTVQTLKHQVTNFYYLGPLSLDDIEAASARVRVTVGEDGSFTAYVDDEVRYCTYGSGDGLRVFRHGPDDGSTPGSDRDNPWAGATPCASWHQIVGTCTRYSRGTFRGAVVRAVAEQIDYGTSHPKDTETLSAVTATTGEDLEFLEDTNVVATCGYFRARSDFLAAEHAVGAACAALFHLAACPAELPILDEAYATYEDLVDSLEDKRIALQDAPQTREASWGALQNTKASMPASGEAS